MSKTYSEVRALSPLKASGASERISLLLRSLEKIRNTIKLRCIKAKYTTLFGNLGIWLSRIPRCLGLRLLESALRRSSKPTYGSWDLSHLTVIAREVETVAIKFLVIVLGN